MWRSSGSCFKSISLKKPKKIFNDIIGCPEIPQPYFVSILFIFSCPLYITAIMLSTFPSSFFSTEVFETHCNCSLQYTLLIYKIKFEGHRYSFRAIVCQIWVKIPSFQPINHVFTTKIRVYVSISVYDDDQYQSSSSLNVTFLRQKFFTHIIYRVFRHTFKSSVKINSSMKIHHVNRA